MWAWINPVPESYVRRNVVRSCRRHEIYVDELIPYLYRRGDPGINHAAEEASPVGRDLPYLPCSYLVQILGMNPSYCDSSSTTAVELCSSMLLGNGRSTVRRDSSSSPPCSVPSERCFSVMCGSVPLRYVRAGSVTTLVRLRLPNNIKDILHRRACQASLYFLRQRDTTAASS